MNLQLDLQITDADGDNLVIADAIDITVLPAADAPIPPVALDLDGDGAVSFLGLAAGVAYDYDGDGVATQTAWVAPEDGLLARQTEDGRFDIVFTDDAAGATTDLDGLAKAFDSNRDGQLTAADETFDSFGVWQDANSNGVVDKGEFTSLTEAGITAIDLTSDGQGYTAADGDVTVYGTGSFTIKGVTGVLADAAFTTGGNIAANDVMTAARAGQRQLDGALGLSALAGYLALIPTEAAAQTNPGVAPAHTVVTDLSSFTQAQAPTKANVISAFDSNALFGSQNDDVSDHAATHSATRATPLDTPVPSLQMVNFGEDASVNTDFTVREVALEVADVSFADHAMTGSAAMEALLMLGAQNNALPNSAELPNDGLTGAAIADALAGNIVDRIVDHYIGGSAEGVMVHSGTSADHLVGLLSADLSGSAQGPAAVFDVAPVDETAQLALMHG